MSQASTLHRAIEPLWRELRGYTQRLVADLDEVEMVAQPVPGVVMNHPAWLLSHLNLYGALVGAMLRGEHVDDPLGARFGFGTTPSPDRALYPSRDDLLETYIRCHDGAVDALRDASDDHLGSPTPIERLIPRFPTIADLPVQFIIRHNAMHLGQLSAWRRAMGHLPV